MWLDQVAQDVRGAVRSIARYPVSALVAVVSLAFGIGAMTTTLTVRNVIFHKAPPLYRRPGELSLVLIGRPDRPAIDPYGATVPGTIFNAWREGPAAAVTLAAATPGRIREVRTAERTENVRVRTATANLFELLGVDAEIGRTFGRDGAGAAIRPAILSRRIWSNLFGARAEAIGSTVWIEGEPHTIVGVLPQAFWFAETFSAIWVPLDPDRLTADDLLLPVARRPRGMSHEMLASALRPALDRYLARMPAAERQRRLTARGVEGTPLGAAMSLLLPYVLGASVALTLVIACANVAILMIAQWTVREHEIAIRASLGASRGRIVRGLLAESVLLASGGGALGVAATLAMRGLLVQRAGANLSAFDLSIDPSVLGQSSLITLVAGLIVGIAPALYETRRLHANPLSALASTDRGRQRWRHALVVVEITVTIGLLVETGGMLNGYRRTLDADMGFDRRPLLSAAIENRAGIPVAQLVDAVSRLPAVRSAAAATAVPFMAPGPNERIHADRAAAADLAAERIGASPGLFTTLGVPMRDGRDFTTADTPESHVAIVNETLARQLFAGPAIGNRLVADGVAYQIVGVVADYASHPMQLRHTAARLVVPLGMDGREKRLQIVVSAAGDPAPLVPAIRRELRRELAGATVAGAFTYDEVTRVGAEELLVGTAPLVPLIAIGMLLTTAGIYGVLAFAVARRSRELAVRAAIGASGRDLVRLVAAHSGRLLVAGALCGIGITFALSRIARAAGGAGSVYDPDWPSFVIPVAILAAIGAVATYVPSRRVLTIDPATILRSS